MVTCPFGRNEDLIEGVQFAGALDMRVVEDWRECGNRCNDNYRCDIWEFFEIGTEDPDEAFCALYRRNDRPVRTKTLNGTWLGLLGCPPIGM